MGTISTVSITAASASGGEAESGGIRDGAFGGNRVLADLLSAAGRRDGEAFARLYQLTSPWIYYLLRRRPGSVAEAEAAMVTVYVGIWHRAGEFDPSDRSALSWLTSAAYESLQS